MKIFPHVEFQTSSDLKPGDLFLLIDYSFSCLAIQTVERSAFILGPNFEQIVPEPTVTKLDITTALNYGNDYVIKLPTRSDAWTKTSKGNFFLAVTKGGTYLSFNSRAGTHSRFLCFLDLSNGNILEKLPGPAVFTEYWEFCVIDCANTLRPLIQFATGSSKQPQ